MPRGVSDPAPRNPNGGPATLMRFLPRFPKDFPAAIVVVQHMPATFTAQFSRQLAECTSLRPGESEIDS
ncbi:MAG TPA: chemotaxis protein CheB [Candidatus Acidoferrum sp.]|nr:chemotaxis protein CheB [Candidatus Acidoferrum sp.]